ncbi:MAG: AMP-binding protein, partial [bacterium]|nr:AMP-binding protein [bacterium]
HNLLDDIWKKKITTINCTPGMFGKSVEEDEMHKLAGLKHVFLGGEPVPAHIIVKWQESGKCNAEVVNTYGPTECTDVCSYYRITRPRNDTTQTVPIGRPVYGTRLYILDPALKLVPVGVPGELCIAGAGTGPGYINHPALTNETFVEAPGIETQIYKTGDLAKWLQNGNIEFIGRIDRQVKIRGFRIELEEIEKKLLEREEIKDTVVIERGPENEKYLCAYIVNANETTKTYPEPETENKNNLIRELKEYLAGTLPEYMIPTTIITIDKIPLTANGKVDRRALPEPRVETGKKQHAPKNTIQRKLSQIWQDVLEAVKTDVGIDENFFQLGGHSLSAVLMVSRIHKTFNVRLPLAEVFKTPTIRGLARFIKQTNPERYFTIEPVEKKDYYDLSPAQKRIYILQQMEPQNTVYNMPQLIPIETKKDLKKDLERIFRKLIERHESLRTSFHMIEERLVQKVHPHGEINFSIENENRDKNGEKETAFIRPFDLARAPLLRVELAETGNTTTAVEHHLKIDMHHIISDGVSHQQLAKDFTALYGDVELPGLRIQYKDYARWRNSTKEQERMKQQEAYWLKQFENEIPVLEIPIDYPRPAVQRFEGNTYADQLPVEQTAALKKYALEENTTLYILLLGVTYILYSKLSGQEDIVIGTPVAGRSHADLETIIGMFVNTLALRNYPKRKKKLKSYLTEVKKRTLAAFENQDYPFDLLVEKIDVNRDAARNPLFDVMFAMQENIREQEQQTGT